MRWAGKSEADEQGNDKAFGRPGASRGESAYPQIRFVSLAEIGTHVLFGTQMAGYTTSEIALSKTVLSSLEKGMLCLADRNFFGFQMWTQAAATGADLLWRVKKNMRLSCEKRLPDGSYLSRIFPSERDWRKKTNGVVVRVIDYRLDGVADAEPIYRLVTTILETNLTIQGNRMNSRPICAAPASSCAARLRIWSGRSSMAC